MAVFDIDLVGKIGSMALINIDDNDIDYNIFSRLGKEMHPGMVWVSSGASEIGRLDHMKRYGAPLEGDSEDIKADYSSQGQAILMQTYRQFIPQQYSVRQLLVEHQHFNDADKREHIRQFILRCPAQNAIPIINYNDPVSSEESRRFELANLKTSGGADVVECADNDETASVMAVLLRAKMLVILSSVLGIYQDPDDSGTIITEISGKDTDEVIANVREMQKFCIGTSREGSNGAKAKLEYIIEPLKYGTTVIIGHGGFKLSDVVAGKVPRTIIGVR